LFISSILYRREMSLYSIFNPLAEFGEWVAGRKVPIPKKETALRFGILGAANIKYVLDSTRIHNTLMQSETVVLWRSSSQRALTLK
jgi:hypothetical protein